MVCYEVWSFPFHIIQLIVMTSNTRSSIWIIRLSGSYELRPRMEKHFLVRLTLPAASTSASAYMRKLCPSQEIHSRMLWLSRLDQVHPAGRARSVYMETSRPGLDGDSLRKQPFLLAPRRRRARRNGCFRRLGRWSYHGNGSSSFVRLDSVTLINFRTLW